MQNQLSTLWGDIPTLVANISILTLFIGVIIAGIAKGVKELKGLKTTDSGQNSVVAATMLENITLSDWSASNKDVRRALIQLCEVTDSSRRATNENTDELRNVRYSLDALLREVHNRGQKHED